MVGLEGREVAPARGLIGLGVKLDERAHPLERLVKRGVPFVEKGQCVFLNDVELESDELSRLLGQLVKLQPLAKAHVLLEGTFRIHFGRKQAIIDA